MGDGGRQEQDTETKRVDTTVPQQHVPCSLYIKRRTISKRNMRSEEEEEAQGGRRA